MSRYTALIHKEPESDYGVSFPDFPGCVTARPDLDKARGIAEEALAFHIERMTEDVAIIPEGFSRRRPGGPAGDRALSGSRKDLILEQLDQLARLAVSPDNLVDTADIPAAPVENWIRARRGYPRPLKQQPPPLADLKFSSARRMTVRFTQRTAHERPIIGRRLPTKSHVTFSNLKSLWRLMENLLITLIQVGC